MFIFHKADVQTPDLSELLLFWACLMKLQILIWCHVLYIRKQCMDSVDTLLVQIPFKLKISKNSTEPVILSHCDLGALQPCSCKEEFTSSKEYDHLCVCVSCVVTLSLYKKKKETDRFFKKSFVYHG